MQVETCIKKFRALLGKNGSVIVSSKKKEKYLIDWRKKTKGQAIAVVEPRNVVAVQKIVRFCQQHKIAITPQGGNTGKCGGCIPNAEYQNSIVLSLQQLNRVRDYDPINQTITVDSGCRLEDVQNICQKDNLYFPLSLTSAPACTIGGNLSTNAGGCCVIQNGMTRNHVLGIEVVLDDGHLYSDLRKIVKNNDSYDIKDLFIGSEGTLGIITAAVLKLKPKPQDVIHALIGLHSIKEAVDAAHQLRKIFSATMESMEFFSERCRQIVEESGCQQSALPFCADGYIMIDLVIYHKKQKKVDQENLEQILKNMKKRKKITSYHISTTKKERARIWSIRRSIPLAERHNHNIIKNDIALPLSSWFDFYNDVQQLKKYDEGLYFLIFGHLGDGSLHFNICTTKQKNAALIKNFHALVKHHGGSIAAEHGVGQTKCEFVDQFQTRGQKKMMAHIKRTFDPQGLFNPGKKLSPQS